MHPASRHQKPMLFSGNSHRQSYKNPKDYFKALTILKSAERIAKESTGDKIFCK
jgi:hypothetical protein